jgi:hypothetical protein
VLLNARVYERMASGVVVIPRLRGLDWQCLGKRVQRRDIHRV